MIAATVCSGIGAPETAMPHWRWSFGSEIETAPRAILAHRHGMEDARRARQGTGAALWGDFTTIRVRHLRRLGIELPRFVIAGTPCQSYSIAGLRKSLSDDRGNLTLEFLRLAHSLRRSGCLDGFLWENVPGVLSTHDNAFGCFLAGIVGADDALLPSERPRRGRSNALWRWQPAGRWPALDDEGNETGEFVEREAMHIPRWASQGMVAGPWARVAWRVLDAQYFGLAQRRERVFLVASFVDGLDPAAVLFERIGVHGNPAPRRETGEGVTHDIAPILVSSGRGGGRTGESRGQDPIVAVQAFGGNNCSGPVDISPALTSHGGPHGRMDFESEAFVVGALSPGAHPGGFNGQDAYTGHIVPVAYQTSGNCGAWETGDITGALDTMTDATSHVVAFDMTQITSPANYSNPQPGDPVHPLASAAHAPAVAFDMRGREGGAQFEGPHDTANIRAASGGSSRSYVAEQWAVRRLMPLECERLQGFDDGFTAIPYKRRKIEADEAEQCALGGAPVWQDDSGQWFTDCMADGPRYKAIGNSQAVPVVRWILERVEQQLAPG